MVQMPWDQSPATQIVQCSQAEYDSMRNSLMGSHLADLFSFSPRAAQNKMQGLIPSSTTAFYEVGKAAHCYILEGPNAFHSRHEIAEGPINPTTGSPYGRDTKKFQAWLEEKQSAGVLIVSGDEFQKIIAMAESISETNAKDLLFRGLPEVTIRGQFHGVACQSRLDWVNVDDGYFLDLKTTENLDRFEKDFWKFKYPQQMAFYRGMLDGLGMQRKWSAHMIAVEKSYPHRSHHFEITDATMQDAAEQVKQILLQYRQVLTSFGKDRPWPLSTKFGHFTTQL